MEDEEIVELLTQRSQQAIQELDNKYGKLCFHLAHNILNSARDAEECVNDAYLGVWNAIPPARPASLSAYVGRVVRNIALTLWDRNQAAKRSSRYTVAMEEVEGCLAGLDDVEHAVQARELTRVLEEFLDTLPQKDRVMFVRRYWFADSYQDIAVRVGLSTKNVSVRLTRLRQKLRRHLVERGVLE